MGEPIPSPADVKQATYPDTPYLIVGLKGGSAKLAAWTMRYGQVTPVTLHIGDEPPPTEPLSSAQKIAILASAGIALILMIVIALSLLPPAPVIPP
jgi:hypothetical protein